MGRYFGREPRYSPEELQRQAQEAIDARVSMGRPPDEEFLPLEARLAEADREAAARPPVEPLPEPQRLELREVRTAPPPPDPEPAPARAGGGGQRVATRTSPN